MSSPTQRTLEHCRRLGWQAAVAEKWIPQTQRRIDLFGFVDVVALTGNNIIGIQATSGSNVASRVTKIREERREEALRWLDSGGRVEVWGWRKHKKRVDGRWWQVRRVPVTLYDLQEHKQ